MDLQGGNNTVCEAQYGTLHLGSVFLMHKQNLPCWTDGGEARSPGGRAALGTDEKSSVAIAEMVCAFGGKQGERW